MIMIRCSHEQLNRALEYYLNAEHKLQFSEKEIKISCHLPAD